MSKKLSAAVVVLFIAGCAGLENASSDDNASQSSTSAPLTFSATATQQILDLVNYPTTDVAALTTGAGLESTAAKNIIAERNGADGIAPSADDIDFNTLRQLDQVTGVGAASLTKLAAYAAAHVAPAPETVKTVIFQGWESQSVVWGVNQATAAALDALLDDRAAAALVAHRPFTSVAQMGPLSYMSAAQLDDLLSAAPAWWVQLQSGMGTGPTTLAGKFDGVVFNEAQAETALQIANQATSAQLTGHRVTSTPAARIIAGRPYATLSAVAAVSGVGAATMTALLAYATSGQWASTACVSAFEAAVSPHLPALLFMSESDRPFDVVSFPGQGTSAPTAASVMALVPSTAGSTAQLRDPNNFYVAFEASGAGADPNAAAAVQAAFQMQLTDVVYVAIIPAAGSVNQALVDVYLVGRTSCGDLVGLHAISVET